MDRILITGGAGFIGYHLANFYEKKGYKIIIFDNLFKIKKIDKDFGNLIKKKNIKFINIDLTKKIRNFKYKSFSYIFHLAAINGTSLFYQMPYELCVQNTLININFFNWVKKIKFKKIIYSSTSEVYSQGVEKKMVKIPTDEKSNIIFDPSYSDRLSYAISKFHGEFLFEKLISKTKGDGAIVRFHNIYGPRMGYRHVIPEIITRSAKSKKNILIYGGNQSRAFCYISDAIYLLNLLLKRKIKKDRIFHIGNNCEIKINKVVKIILKKVNKKLKIIDKGPPDSSVGRRSPNIKKILNKVKYNSFTNLESGLEKTINWYTRN